MQYSIFTAVFSSLVRKILMPLTPILHQSLQFMFVISFEVLHNLGKARYVIRDTS